MSSNLMNKNATHLFADLPQPQHSSLASYVWIGRDCKHCRYKTRTLDSIPNRLEECPWWDMCDEVDTFLEPISLFNDPFYPNGPNKLILCENYSSLDKSVLGKAEIIFCDSKNQFDPNQFDLNIIFYCQI